MAAPGGGFFTKPPAVPIAQAKRALHEWREIVHSDFLEVNVQCSRLNCSTPHSGGHPHDDVVGLRVPSLPAEPDFRPEVLFGDAVEQIPILLPQGAQYILVRVIR